MSGPCTPCGSCLPLADCCAGAACAFEDPMKASGSQLIISKNDWIDQKGFVLQLSGEQQRRSLPYLQLYDTVCNFAAPVAAEVA